MTNPYQGFEYKMHIEDYLPGEEQIVPADPATLKGLMEVWRDTANQLNAEKLLTEEARSKASRAYEECQKEKELKDLAIQELNGSKEQQEKLRRHRDELADKVQNARKTRTELNVWLEKYDSEKLVTDPMEFLRRLSGWLNKDLGGHEDNNEAN